MQHVTSGEPIICDDVETLVLATPHKRAAGLWEELYGSGVELHLIGDALAPRTAEEAVLDGLRGRHGNMTLDHTLPGGSYGQTS